MDENSDAVGGVTVDFDDRTLSALIFQEVTRKMS